MVQLETPSGEFEKPKHLFMTDYLKNNQAGFAEVPFNCVDSLVLSTLVYLNLDAYAYGNVSGAQSVPVIDILRFTDTQSMLSGGWLKDSEALPSFLVALGRSRRFADLHACFFCNESSELIEKQFAACTFTFGDIHGCPQAYLAYRGTDGTLTGWKEDFNLSYRNVVPSQRAATRYASGVLSAITDNRHIYLGGHSKGGNLAEFAALTLDADAYGRIAKVFNHDGPSFLEAPSARIDEPEFKAKLDKTVPESSVFGMILESRDDFRIVQSDAMGLLQHVPFTWFVEDCDFKVQNELNESAQLFDTTLDRWLRSCTPRQREVFIATAYELITASDARSWAEFQDSMLSNIATLVRDGHNLDDNTKEIMVSTVKNLGNVAGATLKESIGTLSHRIRKAIPFVDAKNEAAKDADAL